VKRVAGVDLSLSKTGVALLDHETRWDLNTSTIPTKPHPKGDLWALWQRMDTIRAAVCTAVHGSSLVVIEGPSFASVGSASKDLMGLWWLVYDGLVDQRHFIVVVPPSSLKKWATGKGNAGKPQVAIGVDRTFPQAVFGADLSKCDDNELDAVGLAGMGAQALNLPVPFEVTKYRQEALSGLRLPEKEAA
jgi:crossover junction endodeoxyribonuclease RuvC